MPDQIPETIDSFELRSNPELVAELRQNPGTHRERRHTPTAIEVRAGDDGGYEIEGHAAVFNQLSINLGGFREQIDRGAFRKVLRSDPDCWCLFNHDPNQILGRTTAGTLTLREDGAGLVYVADAPDTSLASDLRALFERGDVSQSSFAFRVADDSWEEDDEGRLIRTIHEFAELHDVSPCIYPAYPQTDSGLRSIGEIEDDIEALQGRAWKIHRGDLDATAEERAALDSLLARHSTVSPWTAERTLRAIAEEPELLAAVDGKRARVEFEDEPQGAQPQWLRAARRRRLRQRAHVIAR